MKLLTRKDGEILKPFARRKFGLECGLEQFVERRIIKVPFENALKVVNLERNNFHTVDKFGLVINVVVAVMFPAAEVGDDVDVEIVGGEEAVGIEVAGLKDMVAEMARHRLHFYAPLIVSVR